MSIEGIDGFALRQPARPEAPADASEPSSGRVGSSTTTEGHGAGASGKRWRAHATTAWNLRPSQPFSAMADICGADAFHLRPSLKTGATAMQGGCDTDGFRRALIKRYHYLERAWMEMDLNEDGVLHFQEFLTACRRIGVTGNLRGIFEDLTKGKALLHPSDIDMDLPRKIQELRKRTSLGPSPSQSLEASSKKRSPSPPLRNQARSPLPSEFKGFKRLLLDTFGDMMLAWLELDTNEDGVLQFSEFVNACRYVGFTGNLKRTFSELATDKGVVVPDTLEPGLNNRLELFFASRRYEEAKREELSRSASCRRLRPDNRIFDGRRSSPPYSAKKVAPTSEVTSPGLSSLPPRKGSLLLEVCLVLKARDSCH